MKRSYWWCSQGRNFGYEYNAGLIWAPKRENGKLHHWDAVGLVRPSDIIFSYVREHFVAIGTASADPVMSQRPPGNISAVDLKVGYCVKVEYQLLDPPIDVKEFPAAIRRRLAVSKGPLNKNLTGVQGYLFNVPADIGEQLLNFASGSLPIEPNSRESTIEGDATT